MSEYDQVLHEDETTVSKLYIRVLRGNLYYLRYILSLSITTLNYYITESNARKLEAF